MSILGIDEVGRGPLAGPLVVGAVVLPKNKNELPWVEKLKDSKKLSSAKRMDLAGVILKEAPGHGLGWVSAKEIDELGISNALKLAARRAVEEVQKQHVKFTEIIIDGTINLLEDTSLAPFTTTLIKGDDKIKEISAASIIAKVARDMHMTRLAKKYPGYFWENNMGYGTNVHRDAIMKLGPSPEHRLSYEPCKSLTGFSPSQNTKKNTSSSVAAQGNTKSTTNVGQNGERKVAEYLKNSGHKIIVQNFKTKTCEIDIVSTYEDKIYFTEVKTRKNADHGGGLAAITPAKLKRMHYAAEVFLSARPEYKEYNPLLAAGIVEQDKIKDWFTIA